MRAYPGFCFIPSFIYWPLTRVYREGTGPSLCLRCMLLCSKSDNFGSFRVSGLISLIQTLFIFAYPNSFNILSPAFSLHVRKFLSVERWILFIILIIISMPPCSIFCFFSEPFSSFCRGHLTKHLFIFSL